jgi:hypothetical protein
MHFVRLIARRNARFYLNVVPVQTARGLRTDFFSFTLPALAAQGSKQTTNKKVLFVWSLFDWNR